MSLAVSRGTKKTWSWKLVGLLQIGNAVAFAAVAGTVDFSREADGDQVASATSAAEEPNVENSAPMDPAAATDSPTPDSSLVDAVEQSVQDAAMPTFAIEPTSPAAEPTLPVDPSASLPASSIWTVGPASKADDVEPAVAAPALVNPATNGLAVRCIVNGELVELGPGERRTLSGGDAWVVRFHRGGDFGAAVAPIYDGTHQFVVGPQGWALERTADAP